MKDLNWGAMENHNGKLEIHTPKFYATILASIKSLHQPHVKKPHKIHQKLMPIA